MSYHDIGFMKKLVEQLFDGSLSTFSGVEAGALTTGCIGMNVSIEEVNIRLKPLVHRIVIVYKDGRTDFDIYDYCLMRVTSRTTERQTALDISGPQYGIRFPDFP
jgi:hypothetical protein